MKCIICDSKMEYFFSKTYDEAPFNEMMTDIGKIDFFKCTNCGVTISKTHQELKQNRFEKLNYDFHHYLENNDTDITQPPYIDQATLINVLLKNNIIEDDMVDFAGGYGTLSKVLDKYYDTKLSVYDPYVQSSGCINYIQKDELRKYKTVFSSALFEHIFTRKGFDEINSLVDRGG